MSKPSRHRPIRVAERLALPARALALALALQLAAPPAAFTAPTTADTRPYDERLMRLAELLGAVHYLRELCGANDGQLWRERMRELIQAEGSSALRRARLTRSFNQGYRSYSRTYSACTPSAKTAIERFLTEGAEITDVLVKSSP
ncbi:MAG: TIGR02301 family protein [Pseudomonadota bacterium]